MIDYLTIAIDIDGSIRNFNAQIEKYLETDHPDKLKKWKDLNGYHYRSLDKIFDTKEEVLTWIYDERVFERRMYPWDG